MHLYRQLPSAPHRDALAGFVESVTGVREARPAHAPTLLVPAPTFPAADKATAKRLAKQPPGRLRKAAAKTCRFDALIQATGSAPPCYRPLRFALAAPEPAKRWWQRLLARTPPATVATDDEWFCRLVEPHVVAALAQDEAAVTVDGPAPARTTYTVQALDATGGGVTVEVVVRNPNVPWFAFAERVAAEVAAAAAAAAIDDVSKSDTTPENTDVHDIPNEDQEAPSPPRRSSTRKRTKGEGGDAPTPSTVQLYVNDTNGRPRPWALTGTLLTHPPPTTTLYWAYTNLTPSTPLTSAVAPDHNRGGFLFSFVSAILALLYLYNHVAFLQTAVGAIYSHHHLFGNSVHIAHGVSRAYNHHVAPIASTIATGISTGVQDVVNFVSDPKVHKVVKNDVHKVGNAIQNDVHKVGKAVTIAKEKLVDEASIIGDKITKDAHIIKKAIGDEIRTIKGTVKAHTKGVGGASVSAKKAAARKALRGATLVPLTVLPEDDTVDVPPAAVTTRYFGLLVKRRSHWTCAAVLAMPATAFVGYPPDFYLGQHLLRLTKLVNTVMAGSYAAFCTEAVARLPPAERGPVLRELGRAGKRIRTVVRKHKLPTPLPTLSSPQQMLYEACCHPASKKVSADCKGYKALYHDTLKRSGWLTRKGELRCEAVRPRRRTRRRV